MKIKLHQRYVREIEGVFYIAQQPKKSGWCYGCIAHKNDSDICRILSSICAPVNGNHVTYKELQ